MKNWFASKTLWFNLIMAVVEFIELNADAFPEGSQQIITWIVLIGNAILRFKTDKAVSLKKVA